MVTRDEWNEKRNPCSLHLLSLTAQRLIANTRNVLETLLPVEGGRGRTGRRKQLTALVFVERSAINQEAVRGRWYLLGLDTINPSDTFDRWRMKIATFRRFLDSWITLMPRELWVFVSSWFDQFSGNSFSMSVFFNHHFVRRNIFIINCVIFFKANKNKAFIILSIQFIQGTHDRTRTQMSDASIVLAHWLETFYAAEMF